MAEPDFKQRVEERLNQGLLGQWYVVAKSADVPFGKTLPIKVLGQRLVLWRGSDGVHCLEDYCPHRGARLSRGEVLGTQIACRYHGVSLDGDGRIIQVPAMPECSLEGRKAAMSFIVREACDAIFAYFPSLEKPEPDDLELPYELERDDYERFLVTAPWGCNYRYALDNIADPMHGCYLHADTFTLAYGAKQDLMQIEETQDGFIIGRVGQRGANFDWTEVVTDNSAFYCRLDIPYPQAGGPGGPMRFLPSLHRLTKTIAASSSGAHARCPVPRVKPGASSTGRNSSRGIGMCSNRTARCFPRCPRTRASAKCSTSTTLAFRVCARFSSAVPRHRSNMKIVPPCRPPADWNNEMLHGKTVVVTGAARGLGRDIAIACGRHGATLILGDILEEQGLETIARLKADGVTARFIPVDLGDPEIPLLHSAMTSLAMKARCMAS